MQELNERYKQVKNLINKAAIRADRDPSDVKLIAVSKKQPVKKIKFLAEKGVKIFGESRVQELRDKRQEFVDNDIEWHFIGHLQRNKVKYLMRMDDCTMIHSLDSLRLARKIEKRACKNERKISVLVQVNIAGDKNKFGIKPEKTIEFLKNIKDFKHIDIKGLMTLVPYYDDSEKARAHFSRLRNLKNSTCEKGFELEELSMGMTNDFEVAIEEGATIVRVGRALFGSRKY